MPYQLLRDEDHYFEVVAFTPENVEQLPKLPLIVFLHGSGERGTDLGWPLKGIAPACEELNLQSVVIFPQCDANHRAFYGAMEERVLRSMRLAMKEFPIDSNKVYLIGYSMGGSSNLWLAARHPDKFAALVCIAPGITWLGSEPPPNLPPDNMDLFESMFVAHNRPETIAKQVQHYPIWFLQGDNDEPCPIDETRAVVDELRKLGSHPRVTEYSGVDHDSLEMSLREGGLFEWLFQQSL